MDFKDTPEQAKFRKPVETGLKKMPNLKLVLKKMNLQTLIIYSCKGLAKKEI